MAFGFEPCFVFVFAVVVVVVVVFLFELINSAVQVEPALFKT